MRGKRSLEGAALFAIACVYLFCLPKTVQTLDTGELVASAYRLNVAHPPGFPLYIWLGYLATHLIPLKTVFWRASLLTAAFSVATLALLAFPARRAFFVFGILLPFAFSGAFWRYSVLPDVFMLNALMTAAICSIYFYVPCSPRKTVSLCLLFSLGMANQPTLIFLVPVILDDLIEQGSLFLGAFAALGGAAVFALAYGSLLLLHTGSLFSAGYLRGWTDVARHFLRTDYGTFRLSGRLSGQAQGSAFFESLRGFVSRLLEETPFCLIAFWPALQRKPGRKYLVVFGALIGYLLIFFSLANTSNPLILERFYLFPMVLLVLLSACSLKSGQIRPGPAMTYLFVVLGIGLSGLLLSRYRVENDFSKNTVVSDYAMNFLNMLGDDRRSVVIVKGDTRYFALRYLQSVENVHPDALVFGFGNIFSKTQIEKLAKLRPELRFDNAWTLASDDKRDIIQYVVAPNIDHFDFYFSRDVNLSQFRTTFMGLGRRISKGSGVGFDKASLGRIRRHSSPQDREEGGYSEYKDLYAEYAYYYLKAGLMAESREDSIASFSAALDAVPYCFPALKNLCLLKREIGERDRRCNERTFELQQTGVQYF